MAHVYADLAQKVSRNSVLSLDVRMDGVGRVSTAGGARISAADRGRYR